MGRQHSRAIAEIYMSRLNHPISRALAIVALTLWGSTAWAATLAWNANTEPDLAGYRVYRCSQQPCSRASGSATLIATLGKVTSADIGTPAVVQYYFITAYDTSNNESSESNVATYTPTVTSPPSSPPPPAAAPPPAPTNLHLSFVQ